MGAITPEELARFCDLLQALLSGDNARRQESECLYQETKQCDPDRLCRCLATVLTQAPDETLRQQSAVLLRQCVKANRCDFVWPQLPTESHSEIKAQLEYALQQERSRRTRHKVCDVVSTLACHVLDPTSSSFATDWPTLTGVLSSLVAAADSMHRESALRIVKDMLGLNPFVVQALVSGKMPSILSACCIDESPFVRKEALLLFMAALEHWQPSEWEPLQCLMPSMLDVVRQFERSEDELRECLEAFVQVVDISPSAFQQQLDKIVPMMLTISLARAYLADGVRQMAFEFLTALCEKKAKLCGKYPDFIREMVTLCMEFMLELEDDDNWADADNDSWAVDVSNYDVGEENIDRFAQALGAEVVLSHVFTNVRHYVNQTGWKHKYVAIMTLSQCAETVQEEAHVDEIIQLLISLLSDEHPRVRFAALHAIGQTSTDHSPYLQETHSDIVLPALMRLMDDPVVRVASHACAAFVNFAEDLDIELMLPRVPSLMTKLCRKMVSPVRVAREQAITAIAVIAGVIETDFMPYYQQVVPVLKQIVLAATRKEERALRGKAFECMSLLGLAVGRDVFKPDAQEAMQAMMETAIKGLEADDPQKSYIHEAAQRICRALREDFLPYLTYLLPGIYTTLQLQPNQVVDPDDELEEEDMTIEFLEDGKAVGLKTSQIEDFKSAVQLLACFLEVLGGFYFDHVRETAQHMLPALSFHFSEDVKREANQTWQELITVAKSGQQQRGLPDDGLVADLLRVYLQRTLETMRVEEDLETLQVQALGIAACLKAAGPNTMTPNEVQELCIELRRFIEESTQRQWRATQGGGLDEDELAEAEEHRDADQLLRVKYAELAGTIMEMHKGHFLPAGLQHFIPVIQECLKSRDNSSDHCLAFYLADYMIDKLGADSVPVWPVFMQQMLRSIRDRDAWVRQAAIYGVLHAAPLGDFAQFADGAAKLLSQVISQPETRREGGREALEAATAALGHLCKWQASSITGVNAHLLLFLNNLPLEEDLDQAGPTHELLMQFVEGGHAVFQEQLAKVLKVFLEVYNRETSSEALNCFIRRLFVQAGDEQLKRMQPSFSQKHRKRIEKILRDARKICK